MENKHYIREQDLIEDAFRLGVQIYNCGFRPSFIVGLWRGGSSVGIYVQECLQYLGIETNHISIRTSYSGADTYQQMIDNSDAQIRIHGTQYLLENLNSDDRLLIVDDVISSGLTIQAVVKRLRQRLKRNMPKEVRSSAIWYKSGKNKTEKAPDFYLHKTDNWLVLPYEIKGLTVHEINENKPYLKNCLESWPELLKIQDTN